MATQEPIEITVLVAAILERLGVEYLIGGSLATSLHGIPRATLDADIVADLQLAPPRRSKMQSAGRGPSTFSTLRWVHSRTS